MAYSKDIERLARSLHGQRLETEYIKHYLMETYALDAKAVDQLLERLGIPRKSAHATSKSSAAGDDRPGKQARNTESKPPGQGFY